MNQMNAMKHFGLFLLALGVSLCAAFGSRQSPTMYSFIQNKAAESALSEASKVSFKRYNDARKVNELDPINQTSLPPLELKSQSGEPHLYGGDNKDLVESYLKAISQLSGPHADALEKARRSWLESEGKYRLQILTNQAASIPAPMDRVRGWAAESGIPFLIGLILIAVGAVLARKVQNNGQVSPNAAKDVAPTDPKAFSSMLSDLSRQVSEMREHASAIDTPTIRDAESVKSTIESLQLSHFDPMVEARYALQTSIGLGPFADVFSPLSSGERNLNRAWATLVDEHWSESLSALGRAALSIKRADESLKSVLDNQVKQSNTEVKV